MLSKEKNILQVEYRPIADLLPYARNSRTHSDEQVAQIAASIREFGFTNPILIDEQNGIIAGHGRVKAAAKLKMAELPCIRLDYLSETQRKAYVIADNRLALNAGWDTAMLSLELAELKLADFDLDLLGFDADEMDELLNPEQVPEEGLTDPDEVPEQVETRCKPGDLWILGKHRLLCGDSTNVQHVERLMGGEKADMVFTDPPYGLGKAIKNDAPDEWLDVLKGAFHNVHDVPIQFWWCAAPGSLFLQAMQVIQPGRVLIWQKPFNLSPPSHGFAWHYEPCLYRPGPKPSENKSDVVSMNTIWRKADPENVGHPTQKPVALAEEMMRGIDAPNVLDLFLGSGSTLIACEKTGRRCFGMELDPKYCDVVLSRWEKFTGKQAEIYNG